jgi:zeta-carotene desaturase
VAGLTAARYLAQGNCHVHIFESGNHIGGRMFSVLDRTTGEMVDNGQHLLSSAYSEFLSLLEELGTAVYLKRTKGLKIHFANKKAGKFLLDTSILPGNAGILAGLLKFDALSAVSKFQLMYFFVKLKAKRIQPDNLSCLDLLKRERQSEELIRIFWSPLILAVLNDKPGNVAASLLVEVLERAFFSGGKDAELLLPTRELSVLLHPFEKWLHRHGGDILYRSPVKQIIVENGKAIGVELKNGEKHYADAVISTVQPAALHKLIPAETAKNSYDYLLDFSYSAIINIHYWLSQNITTPDFSAMLGTKSQWLFNRRNFAEVQDSVKAEFPGMLSITISGANELSDIPSEELSRTCFAEIKSCFPEFEGVDILHDKVIKERRATFSAAPEVEKLRPEPAGKIANLYLAGDWTNTKLPATIESAAVSGQKAAAAIKKQHG